MKAHWEGIGFTPSTFVLDANDEEIDVTNYDVPLKDNNKFTPTHQKPTVGQTDSSFSGVVLRNLPVTITENDIKSFLVSKGLPVDHDAYKINTATKNKNVDIEDIDANTCKTLISNIHEQIFFNRKIYCRGLKNLETPVKNVVAVESEDISSDKPDNGSAEEEISVKPKPGNPSLLNKPDPSVPGLSKADSAKAAKKVRQLKNKLDKQKGIKSNEKKNRDLNKSDFLNDSTSLIEHEEDISNQFIFDPSIQSPLLSASKFFHQSPVSPDPNLNKFLTPQNFSSLTARKIQKEEHWLAKVSPNPAKRPSSPEDDPGRRIRSRSESSKSTQLLISKLPLLEKAQGK